MGQRSPAQRKLHSPVLGGCSVLASPLSPLVSEGSGVQLAFQRTPIEPAAGMGPLTHFVFILTAIYIR